MNDDLINKINGPDIHKPVSYTIGEPELADAKYCLEKASEYLGWVQVYIDQVEGENKRLRDALHINSQKISNL